VPWRIDIGTGRRTGQPRSRPRNAPQQLPTVRSERPTDREPKNHLRHRDVGGCERSVETALQSLTGVTRVDADHESDTIDVVEDGVDDHDIHGVIADAGYDIVG